MLRGLYCVLIDPQTIALCPNPFAYRCLPVHSSRLELVRQALMLTMEPRRRQQPSRVHGTQTLVSLRIPQPPFEPLIRARHPVSSRDSDD